MSKYNIVVSDNPWSFSDKLTMSDVKRGASANYSTMTDEELINLPVKDIVADDALLALWCPSSKLDSGLACMKSWGFAQKQVLVWCKTKKEPFKDLIKSVFKSAWAIDILKKTISEYSLNDTLSFGMGHIFRNTHELVLIGTRGKILQHIKNKSQRTVHFYPATKHSSKPETLQDQLDLIFPDKSLLRTELFARRERPGWLCVGNECERTRDQDIRDSLEMLKLMEAA